MKVVVISTETIKPSRPTPEHLRHVQLSFLDQINFPIFQPVMYFYPASRQTSQMTVTDIERRNRLKKSLSETLTKFYPLAGRLRDNLFVDCNDDGVHYLEAEAKCQLFQVIASPNHDELNKLLPTEQLDDVGAVLFAVQVTTFDCGGMAIGACFSHKLADGFSVIKFINSWADASKGDQTNMVCPKFNLALFFPPVPSYPTSTVSVDTRKTKQKIVGKTYVFSASAISALRAKYARCVSLDGTTQPSKSEALSAFIWSRFVAASATIATNLDEACSGRTRKSYAVIVAVNLRQKMNPPLPAESFFGNLSRFAFAVPSMDNTAEGDFGAVTALRDALEKIDGDYVKKLQEGNADPNSGRIRVGGEERVVVRFTITSVYRFPIYEADFGWGKPIWMTMGKQPRKNVVVLLPTRSGDGGIEALVFMEEKDMSKLEADQEFMAFVAKPEPLFLSSL